MFDLYNPEVFREVFKEIRLKPQIDFRQVEREQISVTTRCSENSILPTTYFRNVSKRKSIGNTLKKDYSWLKKHKFIPIDRKKTTKGQIDTHLKKYI